MASTAELTSGGQSLDAARCTRIFELMVRARVLEECMIQMSKSGQSHFWVGGPGEEAFNVCLGLQVKKGCGPAYDFLHLHYRSSATLLAMGMPPIDALRQAAMTLTDPHSMGRNFVGHFAHRAWNVMPVSSIVQIQFAMAPGTAWVQRRHGGDGITVVVGGDAGTAEPDFSSCMLWSSRPGQQLPVLMIVVDNRWGISTCTAHQQNAVPIIERGRPFDIPSESVDGNDPLNSWHAIRRGIAWCREQRRPFLLEASVSRLHGHSSASGAERRNDEIDCVQQFQERLIQHEILSQSDIAAIWATARQDMEQARDQVLSEPQPTSDDLHTHTYAPSPCDTVYPHDYTGLPGNDSPGMNG